jgi:hypothetical protein
MSGEELEEISFPNEELEKIIHETIEAELGTKNYEEKEVGHWINRINEVIMEKLVVHQKPFKYLLNTLIMQRKGANVVVSQSNIWTPDSTPASPPSGPRKPPTRQKRAKTPSSAWSPSTP